MKKYILNDIERTIWNGFFWEDVYETYNSKFNINATAGEFEEVIANYKAAKSGGRDIVLNYYARKTEGINLDRLTEVSCEYIENNTQKFFTYVIPFFEEAIKNGYDIFFATAGPTYFAEAFKQFFEKRNIKISGYLCTKFYENPEGQITKSKEDNTYIEIFPEKEQLAFDLIQQKPGQIIVMGDHKDDIKMMEPVSEYGGKVICIDPATELLERAQKEGWIIYNTKDDFSELIMRL